MKKLSSKILLIVMAVTLILSLNATVNATAEDMAVLENANGDYLIYLNGHLNDEYSYAITTSADVEENNLNWYTAEDTKGNKVIKAKDQVGSYLWVKIDDEIIKKAEPINISEVSTEAEINEMKTLTNRIKVDATQTITEETREENVIRTVTQGTLKITDDANAKYMVNKESELYGTDFAYIIDLDSKKFDIYWRDTVINSYDLFEIPKDWIDSCSEKLKQQIEK